MDMFNTVKNWLRQIAELGLMVIAAAVVLEIIFGAVLFLLIQAFALALGLLSPSIHAARLHFVEWMGKFHDGSGEPFAPLGGTNRYSKEGV